MTDHPLIEIVEHRTSTEAAQVVAEEAAAWLGICAVSRRAMVALPGGRSPTTLLAALAAHPLDWRKIVVTTTDERRVPVGHPLSNMGAVRRAFAGNYGQTASFVWLEKPDAMTCVNLPFDLSILGMGTDGHIASLFPGSPMESGDRALIEVTPDPLPPEAPVGRRSWSLSALASARRTFLVIAGEAKRVMLDAALVDPATSPVGALLRRASGPVSVHWAEREDGDRRSQC